jgi:hypothetical protein
VSEDQQAIKKQKASNKVLQQVIKPKQSYWPFALAASLTISLVGVMSYPIVIWVGAALVIVSFIGWGLERR